MSVSTARKYSVHESILHIYLVIVVYPSRYGLRRLRVFSKKVDLDFGDVPPFLRFLLFNVILALLAVEPFPFDCEIAIKLRTEKKVNFISNTVVRKEMTVQVCSVDIAYASYSTYIFVDEHLPWYQVDRTGVMQA